MLSRRISKQTWSINDGDWGNSKNTTFWAEEKSSPTPPAVIPIIAILTWCMEKIIVANMSGIANHVDAQFILNTITLQFLNDINWFPLDSKTKLYFNQDKDRWKSKDKKWGLLNYLFFHFAELLNYFSLVPFFFFS